MEEINQLVLKLPEPILDDFNIHHLRGWRPPIPSSIFQFFFHSHPPLYHTLLYLHWLTPEMIATITERKAKTAPAIVPISAAFNKGSLPRPLPAPGGRWTVTQGNSSVRVVPTNI